jgi:RNA-directed DNA polymerase
MNEFDQVNSYFGLLRQATHSHADRVRLANAARQRGLCVDMRLTKAYERKS